MPLPINSLISKGFELLAQYGFDQGARYLIPQIQQIIGEKAFDFTINASSGYLALKLEEFLQEVAPDIDEIPDEILTRVSQSELAVLGKKIMQNLGDEARQAVSKAGISTSQFGAAVLLSLLNSHTNSDETE